MGVPGYFASLFQRYKNDGLIRSVNDISTIEALYLDANCLIHPVCAKVFSENKELVTVNLERLEGKMIREVINYIEMLVNMIKPTKLVYIAVDGVAPMAKIKHQRQRRFKSIKEHEVKGNIALKHGKEYPKQWNNSAITPGTHFMKKLSTAILAYLQGKPKNPESNRVQYIFSSCNTPSEGEHKILQHIRSYHYETKMIYGLDADLIFLALACDQSRISLLRETAQVQNNMCEGFSVVDIDKLRQLIISEIDHQVDPKRFIKDYIFMAFFLGNDFVPSIPSINFKNTKASLNGYNILIQCYNDLFDGDYLLNENNTINMGYFTKMLEYLSMREEPYFREARNTRRYVRHCDSNDSYDIEIHHLENLMFKIPDPIELGKDGVRLEDSKRRYYEYYHMDPMDAVEKYLEAMQWTVKYYFHKCPDWIWYYKYESAPFISDIYRYLQETTMKDAIFINGLKFIKPLQQLLMVLPPKSSFLLPKPYRALMETKLKDYYPNDFDIDLVLKTKYWQGVPKVPMVDPWVIVKETQDVELSKNDELRNRHLLEFRILI